MANLFDLLEALDVSHGRLVAGKYLRQGLIDLVHSSPELRLRRNELFGGEPAFAFDEAFQDLPQELCFDRSLDGLEALFYEIHLAVVELGGFDEYLFGNPYLAEVVKEGRVLKFFDLLRVQVELTVNPMRCSVDDSRQLGGHVRNTSRMASRGRVSTLDGTYRSLHKVKEKPVDPLVETVVLDRDRRLAR